MTSRKRRSFGTIGDPNPTLRELTIRAPHPDEATLSPGDPKPERPPAKKIATAKGEKGYRVVSLSLPLTIDEALTSRAKTEDVGRGRIVWMACQRHGDDVSEVTVPAGRRVMTRVYLHSPEIEELDAIADRLDVSRSHVVAAILHEALA